VTFSNVIDRGDAGVPFASIPVGTNLSYSTTVEDLLALFLQFGNIARVVVCTDQETGASRGFGFIDFESAEDSQYAITQIDGTEFQGRRLTVSDARDNPARGRCGGGGERW